MVEEFYQNLQTFVAGEFFVKIAVGLLSLSEAAKFLCPFFHKLKYRLGREVFRANLNTLYANKNSSEAKNLWLAVVSRTNSDSRDVSLRLTLQE